MLKEYNNNPYQRLVDMAKIAQKQGGVIKGTKGMNEIGPHRLWAERLVARATAYGVIENKQSYLHLFNPQM